jgi:hypothetical protein
VRAELGQGPQGMKGNKVKGTVSSELCKKNGPPKKYSCRRAAVVSIYSRIFLLFKTNASVAVSGKFVLSGKGKKWNSAEQHFKNFVYDWFVLSRAFFNNTFNGRV